MRAAQVVFLLTGVGLAAAAYWGYRYALTYPDRPLSSSTEKVKVVIPRGANFTRVTNLLADARLLENGAAFRVFANYKGVASKARAGTYTFSRDITPRKLLDILVHGVPAPTVKVTIPEGKNMLEVATLLSAKNIAPRDDLIKQMRNRRFLRRVGVPGATIEGFLFPDTYKFRAPTPTQEVLEHMVRRHKGVYYALRRKYPSSLRKLRDALRWGHFEITTLASIVEKETGQAHERPLIAGVFLNRLTFRSFSSRLLQTDPTIIYGCTVPEVKSAACQKFKGRIRRIHLNDQDNPYNTYAHPKLPPGPIANPGKAALEAVLNPKKSRYLYFVSRNDGTHKFSATEAEHERAVDKYQRGK